MSLVIDGPYGAERIIVGKTTLEELSEEAARDLDAIGTSHGTSVIHCAFLEWKANDEFEARVVGYRKTEYDASLGKHEAHFEEQPTMEVTFYGRK